TSQLSSFASSLPTVVLPTPATPQTTTITVRFSLNFRAPEYGARKRGGLYRVHNTFGVRHSVFHVSSSPDFFLFNFQFLISNSPPCTILTTGVFWGTPAAWDISPSRSVGTFFLISFAEAKSGL